jgi:predicted acetyltransferase
MGDRLKNRYYCHKKLFMADINRIFTNCRSYNKPDTEYYKCANVTEKFFLTKWKDAGLGEKVEKKNLFGFRTIGPLDYQTITIKIRG